MADAGAPNEAASSKKDRGARGAKEDRAPVAEPQLPPLPSVEDVGDIEVRPRWGPSEERRHRSGHSRVGLGWIRLDLWRDVRQPIQIGALVHG